MPKVMYAMQLNLNFGSKKWYPSSIRSSYYHFLQGIPLSVGGHRALLG